MQPIYLVEHQGLRARYFVETDRDSNSRAQVIGLIRSGEVNPVKVIEVCEDEGTVRNVTEEFLHCAKWGDHVTEQTPLATASDHARDLRKHEVVS
jgi:hypothetical protein